MCVLIRVASSYHLTFTTEHIHNVSKTFLPLVTRPCRFDQITRRKIKPRTEGFINHFLMAAILIFTQPRPQGLLALLSPPYRKARRPWGRSRGVQKLVGSLDLSHISEGPGEGFSIFLSVCFFIVTSF